MVLHDTQTEIMRVCLVFVDALIFHIIHGTAVAGKTVFIALHRTLQTGELVVLRQLRPL